MNHKATPRFWHCFRSLPAEVQRLGLHDRAMAIEDGSDLVWFWIETHAEYDRLIGHA
ncbi:MAG: hypothetical protein NVSMB9_32010 [Isosphaeraceae bacterium]